MEVTKNIRVSKYNPIHRDSLGHYKKDEWTSYDDIGSSFDGKLLDRKTYLETESRYIKAIELYCSVNNCKLLKFVKLEKYSVEKEEFIQNGDDDLWKYYQHIENELLVTNTDNDWRQYLSVIATTCSDS